MNLLSKMPIKPKLISMFLLIGLVPLITVGWWSEYQAASALQHEALQKMSAVTKIKKNTLESEFNDLNGKMRVTKDDPFILEAMLSTDRAFEEGGDSVQSAQWKEAAAKVDARLKDIAADYGWYDILLIHADGDIVYTVSREDDLGMVIPDSELKNSNLGKAFNALKNNPDSDAIVIADFAPYAPSGGAFAGFALAKLNNEKGQTEGYLAVQLPIEPINDIIQERAGMGKTGESYLVGLTKGEQKASLRSDRVVKEGKIGSPKTDKFIEMSLAGQSGLDVKIGSTGSKEFVSYMPVEIDGLNWGIITSIEADEVNEPVVKLVASIIYVGAGAAVLIFILALLISSSIARPIKLLDSVSAKIKNGDLNARLDENFGAEMGSLQNSIFSMVEMLKGEMDKAEEKSAHAIEQTKIAQQASEEAKEALEKAENAKREGMIEAGRELETIVNRISTASDELSVQTDQSSQGSEIQRERIGETATAMEEMNATVLEVARNAGQAADSSQEASEMAQQGANIVSQVVDSIVSVQNQALELKANMNALGEQAEGIGAIMNVISDIADQTNLLALNAAIEAARAGEAGRGFAVVADEVRKLAEKTMSATQEVGSAINQIQQGSRLSVSSMDKAVDAIQGATGLANKSGESLNSIVSLVTASTDQVQSIAAASEEQSAASEQINHSIEEVNQIAIDSAESMQQAAMAVNELNSQSQELLAIVDKLMHS